VNARGTWLLIGEFGRRYKSQFGRGRILTFTSDHTVGNVPYGASKGGLDRITIAAAQEFANIGVTANVINPGPTDTGWMTSQLKSQVESDTPLGRIGSPSDAASLVCFLCSDEGGWVNGQLINSNGGFHAG
jgi:3-oxoacyl-[acyl-carrier protein] reductase